MLSGGLGQDEEMLTPLGCTNIAEALTTAPSSLEAGPRHNSCILMICVRGKKEVEEQDKERVI